MTRVIAFLLAFIALVSCSSTSKYVHTRSADISMSGLAAKPVKIVNPRYPKKAAQEGIGGWVLFEFNLDSNGHPNNLVVKDSHPGNTFVQYASAVIQQWRFEQAESGQKDKNFYYVVEFVPF